MAVTTDERLQAIFCKAFNVEQLPDEAAPGTVALWDSLGHLALITELELQFGVKFTVEEWSQMVSVRAIKEILADRGIH